MIGAFSSMLLLALAAGPGAASYTPARVRAAIEKSIALFQKSGPIVVKKGTCTSCHHQSLPLMMMAEARSRGIPIDESVFRQQVEAGARVNALRRDPMLQGVPVGGAQDTLAYTLLGLAAGKYPSDATTDAMAYHIRRLQQPDGRWTPTSHRPPTEYSDVTTTAISLRALQLYAPPAARADFDASVRKAAAWLVAAVPRETEERAFKVLGLVWSKAPKAAVRRAARELASEQRPDGGWSQLAALESDAYATGETLVALYKAGELAAADPAYRRGVEFLLKTQLPDGSWHVRTRAIPIMPYFESGFPHGPDQWISAFATSWASMALTLTLEPVQTSSR